MSALSVMPPRKFRVAAEDEGERFWLSEPDFIYIVGAYRDTLYFRPTERAVKRWTASMRREF